MFEIPPLQHWDALHPAISHFPIALLIVAPLFLILCLCLRSHRRTLLAVALGLTVAGTLGVYLAAASGDEAKSKAPQTPEVKAALDLHEDLGSTARAVFSGLTVLLAALAFSPRLLKKPLSERAVAASVVALAVLYGCAGLILLNTAHSGGLLVHKLGVHAPIR